MIAAYRVAGHRTIASSSVGKVLQMRGSYLSLRNDIYTSIFSSLPRETTIKT